MYICMYIEFMIVAIYVEALPLELGENSELYRAGWEIDVDIDHGRARTPANYIFLHSFVIVDPLFYKCIQTIAIAYMAI